MVVVATESLRDRAPLGGASAGAMIIDRKGAVVVSLGRSTTRFGGCDDRAVIELPEMRILGYQPTRAPSSASDTP
jgi:hypothetical protein